MAGVLTGTLTASQASRGRRVLYTSDALDATSTSSKATAPLGLGTMVTVQAVTDGSFSGTVAFKLQASNDNVNWDDIPSATSSIASASASSSIEVINAPGAYVRFQVTSAGGGGTVTPSFLIKGW